MSPVGHGQAFKRDGLGIIAIVDDLNSRRAVSVGECGHVQGVRADASNSGTDSSGILANEAGAKVRVCPETLGDFHLGSVVNEEERLIVLGDRSARFAIVRAVGESLLLCLQHPTSTRSR